MKYCDKTKHQTHVWCLIVVIPARFERATHSLEGCCSIQLSYGTGTANILKKSILAKALTRLGQETDNFLILWSGPF